MRQNLGRGPANGCCRRGSRRWRAASWSAILVDSCHSPGPVSDAGRARAVDPVIGPASESLRRTNPRESGEDLPVYGDLARRRLCRGMILARSLRAESRLRLWIDRCCRAERSDRGLVGDTLAVFAGAGMKRVRCRERDVPAKECGAETARITIALNPDPSAGGRAARCAAACKDLDNEHAAAAARAWPTMIGRGVWIGGVVHCRRINLRHWSGQ